MSVRLLVALALIVGALGVGAALTAAEGRLEPTPPPRPTWAFRPPSEHQAYARDARRQNLRVAGLRGDELARAEALAAEVVRDGASAAALQRLPWQVVRRTLCRDAVPAFYRAAPLLLVGDGDDVAVLDLAAGVDRVPEDARDLRTLEPRVARAEALYRAFELPADGTRRPDAAALLALAALVTGQLDAATASVRADPWVAPEPGPDPLARVRRTLPRGVLRVPEYLGRVEGLAELVQADPGVYGCTGGGR
jgi:hypothetical protein